MSATGRSDVRHPDDFYATPAWCTRAILPFLALRPGMQIAFDPCCGNGAILDVLRSDAGAGDEVYGYEIDADRARCAGAGVVERDALGEQSWRFPIGGLPIAADLIITNPPYRLAMQFVARALAEVEPTRGVVAMLLRLNWLGSQARASFHRTHPSEVYVLPRRPSFTGGGTDATEYAWFVWRKAAPPPPLLASPGRFSRGTWQILDVEPKGGAS